MSDVRPTRDELEAVWRSRVQNAKMRLDFARNYLKEIQRDLRKGMISSSDGHFALQQALRSERNALAEYARVLRCFTDLVVHGKTAEEADKPQSRQGGSRLNQPGPR